MPKLRVVTGNKGAKHGPRPSRPLGKHGQKLWDAIQDEFDIGDAAGIEILTLACQQLDRAEAMKSQIDEQGEFMHTKGGSFKEHPGIRHELHARQYVAKALHNLGLDVEPIKAIGRPSVADKFAAKHLSELEED